MSTESAIQKIIPSLDFQATQAQAEVIRLNDFRPGSKYDYFPQKTDTSFWRAPSVIILGSGPLANAIISKLEKENKPQYRLVACVDNAGPDYLHRLKQIVEIENANYVVVCLHERRGFFPAEELLMYKANGIRVEEGSSFFEKISGMMFLSGLRPSTLVYGQGFRRFRFVAWYKRLTDVLMACAMIVLLLPFFIILPLVIKLESPGPVLFRQERIGHSNKNFMLFKFRSMYCVDHNETRWTEKNDTRITRVGRYLRRFRLDELPQLWNVLRGDMSFVGPRPDVPSLFQTLHPAVPYYSLRTAIKPGITGWAQVRYQYVSSVEEGLVRHQYDLFYSKNMSLLLDLRILFETVKIIICGKGA